MSKSYYIHSLPWPFLDESRRRETDVR